MPKLWISFWLAIQFRVGPRVGPDTLGELGENMIFLMYIFNLLMWPSPISSIKMSIMQTEKGVIATHVGSCREESNSYVLSVNVNK